VGWNERRLGLGGVQVTYLKINFGLKSNVPRAGLGEILKFWPLQASIVVFHELNLLVQFSRSKE
jgi:hypothetical protein